MVFFAMLTDAFMDENVVIEFRDMQRMVDLFAEACARVCLTISIKTTEVMLPRGNYVEPVITINGQKLKATGFLISLVSLV